MLSIFCLALVVRAINLATLGDEKSFFAEADSAVYWALGGGLSRTDSFWPTFAGMTDRMPLYPLLIAGVRGVFGDAAHYVAWIQALIDAGTCALIAALGRRLSPSVGLIAGALAALSPTLLVLSTQILTDTLFVFFFTLMLVLCAAFAARPAVWLALAAGLAGGLSAATRAVDIPLLAVVPLVVLATGLLRKKSAASALTAAMVFAAGVAAPVSPVIVRNAALFHTLSLTSQTGDYLALWIAPLVKQRADGTPYAESADRITAETERRLSATGEQRDDPFVRSSIETQIAREELAQLPLSAKVKSWIEGAAVNLFTPAVILDPRVRALPKPSFYATSGAGLVQRSLSYLFDDFGTYQLVLIVGLALVVPFAVLGGAGFVLLLIRVPWIGVLAGGVCLYFLLVNGPIASPKYRLPIEPALIMFCAIALASLWRRKTPLPAG